MLYFRLVVNITNTMVWGKRIAESAYKQLRVTVQTGDIYKKKDNPFPLFHNCCFKDNVSFFYYRMFCIFTDFLVVVGQRVIKWMYVEYRAGKNEQIALAFWHAHSCESVRKDCHFTSILKPNCEELSAPLT